MWFVGVQSVPSTARITTGGVVTGIDVGMVGPQSSITVGSDGNLWTAPSGSEASNVILRVTPAGSVTSFTIASQANQIDKGAHDLTLGPDGNVWFTEFGQRRIARITPAGAITEFALPPSISNVATAAAIVGGPDGNVWFTAFGAKDFIGRITTSGAVTAFPLSTYPARPEDICVGPDGNLWFTEGGAGKIGRCTTAGEITEFPIPMDRIFPFGIASGPDGNIWFASSSWIGRVNLSYVAALEAQKVPSLETWAGATLAVTLAFAGCFLLRGRG
jgi:virginiamycin B lyase